MISILKGCKILPCCVKDSCKNKLTFSHPIVRPSLNDFTKTREWQTADFDYDLPPDRIAQHPLEKRDASRLQVIHKDRFLSFEHRYFHELPTILPPRSLLILNNTRVFPARFTGKKTDTGGRVEVFLLHQDSHDVWSAIARGKMSKGTGLELADGALSAVVEEVLGEGKVRVRFSDPKNLDEKIERKGLTPLPPYIHRKSPLQSDSQKYQTVFAKVKGAVAAPTAGLHFTKALLKQLKTADFEIAFLTLHVGLGTFAPVRCERLSDHKMEPEFFILPRETADAIHRAKEERRCVVAVGSTAVRVLESAATGPGRLKPGQGWTNLFIAPGYRFRISDALITNFHLPRSTLLALTCAFGGYKNVMDAYRVAVEQNYRFYSYGDASLIL